MTKKKTKIKNMPELIFSSIYTLIVLVFVVQLILLDKLPFLYLGMVVGVLLLVTLGLVALQFGKKINKSNKTLGKVLMGLLAIILMVGNVYIFKTSSALKNMINNNTDKIEVAVVVMKDSPIKEIKELSQQVGVISVGDSTYVDHALEEMKEENDSFDVNTYADFNRFADALYDGSVEAIVLDMSFVTQFEENHPTFSEDTRVIKSYYYEEEKDDIVIDTDVTKDTFTVYLSGIDQRGSIGVRGRSDVNKVLTINPKTRQILIVDIPRDYYVKQVCQYNQLDKLTHTGIFGVDCTVQSVANYMGIDINYYVRVNFSSLEKIVDALGGIEVESVYNFNAQGYSFSKGTNYLNGAQALAFSRERYSLPNGDFDRIQNQTRVLEGMIKKAISPSITTNYLSFMDAISGTFQTNMPESDINDLIKMQLNDMRGWNIVSDQLSGTGGMDWTPANGFNAYVCYPDGTSLDRVLTKIEAIKNGEVIK